VTKNPTLEVCIALIIRIVNMCHFRLGNLKYKDMYKSYGIITIEVRHLKIKSADKATISFIGKKAVKNDCIIECKTTVAHLANMIKNKSSREAVFSYDLEDCETAVRATDINNWMRDFGADITSKMFRTYATNVMLIGLLREMGSPEPLKMSQRKKNLNSVLDDVSDLVHNTRAVCKKEYTHPDLIKMYLDQPRKFKAKFIDALDPEPAFLSYLRSTI
jgi:DNA topoisomerase-1